MAVTLEINYVHPPIPIRTMDYMATFSDYYGEGSPIGHGSTEALAVSDLVQSAYHIQDDMTDEQTKAIAEKYPCDDCGGNGFLHGCIDDECGSCAYTGINQEIEL